MIVFVIHICKKFASLLVLITLASGGSQKRRTCWHRRELEEISAEDFGRQASPCLLWLHVLGGVQAIAQAAAIRGAQSVGMQKRAVDATKLVYGGDASLANKAVDFLLRLCVAA